ncbi:MAG: SIS domain-containing protein [Candidatus Eremiobacterota bacterium]
MGKVIEFDLLTEELSNLREQGKKIVLCHGCFDLMHPGHIKHFQAAKQMGDILVVTVTPDIYVDKGPGRPAYSQDLRVSSIAALECVDFTSVNKWPTAEETLKILRPHIYVKGQEFEKFEDKTGKLQKELKILKEIGCEMSFTHEVVFSSTELINKYLIDAKKQTDDLIGYFNKSSSKSEYTKYYLSYLTKLLTLIDTDIIESIINAFIDTGERGNTIYFIGNGGSAVTASHFANDIGIGTRANGKKIIKAVSLVDNMAVVTAVANDEGYNNVFLYQLEALLQPEDLVFALSVSGNSKNIIEAVKYAKKINATTIGCTGFTGGILKEIVDISVHIPTPDGEYGPVEDIFAIIGHLIYSYLRINRRGYL